MQMFHLGRAPRTKETLTDFLKWRRVTRPPLVFRGLTGSQRTPGFWGFTNATYGNESLYSIVDKLMLSFPKTNPRGNPTPFIYIFMYLFIYLFIYLFSPVSRL